MRGGPTRRSATDEHWASLTPSTRPGPAKATAVPPSDGFRESEYTGRASERVAQPIDRPAPRGLPNLLYRSRLT